MKKFRKIMAVLVAAMMVMAMCVPAWATTTSDLGRMDATDTTATTGTESKYGTITIANAKKGETYTAYRIFDLASFTDDDIATGSHEDKTEAYSYVISESSPWWTWFQTQAVLTTTTADDTKYFTYEEAPVTLTDALGVKRDNYHVVYANPARTDFTNNNDDSGAQTMRTGSGAGQDADGTAKGIDYMTDYNADIQAFARLAAAEAAGTPATYAVANWSYTRTASADGSMTVPEANSGKIPLGYYLISTSMGTLATLDTTNKNVTVYEKNDEPAITKTVANPTGTETYETATYHENVSADIGDTVYFKTTITAQQGAKDYVLHDVMEDGFVAYTDDDFSFIQKITLTRPGDTPVTYELPMTIPSETSLVGGGTTDGVTTNWTPANKNLTDKCRFEIAFEDSFIGKTGTTTYTALDIKDGDVITVYYSAVVDTDAAIYGNTETPASQASVKSGTTTIADQPYSSHNDDKRNTNTTILTYGGASYTTWDTATVTTYQFDIVKTKEHSQSYSDYDDLLAGAKFSLYKATDTAPGDYNSGATSGQTGYYVVKNVGTTPYYLLSEALVFDDAAGYRFAGDADTTVNDGQVNQITSYDNKDMLIYGLESGTYILEEDSAPTGYNKLAYPIAITINPDADFDGDNTGDDDPDEGTITYTVVNNDKTSSGATTKPYGAVIGSAAVEGATIYFYNLNETNQGGLEIVNKTAEELPSTGGMGTTVLYIVGGMLVILAGAYLFFSRKRTA